MRLRPADVRGGVSLWQGLASERIESVGTSRQDHYDIPASSVKATRRIPCSDQRPLRRTAAITRHPQITPLPPGHHRCPPIFDHLQSWASSEAHWSSSARWRVQQAPEAHDLAMRPHSRRAVSLSHSLVWRLPVTHAIFGRVVRLRCYSTCTSSQEPRQYPSRPPLLRCNSHSDSSSSPACLALVTLTLPWPKSQHAALAYLSRRQG